MNKSIFILNTLEAGIDLINLLKGHLNISGIIALKNENIDHLKISGYSDQSSLSANLSIPLYEMDTYSLKSDHDKSILISLEIDILIVSGWQRLIPDYLINHSKVCIGAHGSPFGITEGRGRSPQNWALILGLKKFYFSIFKIDSGIDSGEIIDSDFYELSDFDDIKTSYKKLVLLQSQLLIKNIKNGHIFENGEKQSESGFYLPKRTEQDGKIDWDRTDIELYNFVRALTKPYPGAFTEYNDSIIKIWKVRPIQFESNANYSSGEIITKFSDSTFIVKTKENALLIEDYESEINLKTGMIFTSASFANQMKKIIETHEREYPENPLHKAILQFK